MLTENKSVRQRPDEGYRRWFTSRDYDLILWYQDDGINLKGFQLCYDKRSSEKAFTFEFSSQGHHYVSKAERLGPGFGNIATGILRDDAGAIGPETVAKIERELTETEDLEAQYRNLVLKALTSYSPT